MDTSNRPPLTVQIIIPRNSSTFLDLEEEEEEEKYIFLKMPDAMGEEQVSKQLAVSQVERQCRRRIPPDGRKFAGRKTRRGNAITLRRPRSLGCNETRENKEWRNMLFALKFHR